MLSGKKMHGRSLTDVLPTFCPEAAFRKKKDKLEPEGVKREEEKVHSPCQQMVENAMVHMLASGESFS